MVHRQTIGDFIREEMHRRGLSLRGFAEGMKSTHTTDARVIESGNPQIDFLQRLSRFTGVSLDKLVAIAFPDYVHQVPAEVELIAERINGLSSLEREIILDILDGKLFKERNKPGDK